VLKILFLRLPFFAVISLGRAAVGAKLLLSIVTAGTAFAHSGDDLLSAWYRSLTGEAGVSCCSEEDCKPVQAKLIGNEWQVLDENDWEVVPADAILNRENIDGRPILCRVWNKIQCFVPPPES
jgi:hypothetical protein